MNNGSIVFGRDTREGWEDEEKHSYDVKVLEKEYDERLYSEQGRVLLNVPKDTDRNRDQSRNERP